MPRRKLPDNTWRAELSDKEAKFVEHYLVDLNPGKAAIAAGYGNGNLKSATQNHRGSALG